MLLILSLLNACGGNSGPTVTPTPPVPPVAVNGNFSITGTSQAAPANNFEVHGPLLSDPSGTLTAKMVMQAPNSSCFSSGQIALKGTVNGQGQLILANTGSPLNGQVVQVMATVSSDGQTISRGTYTIAGGCLGGEHGTISGFMFQPVTGTYQGSFTAGGSPINITAVLTQTSTVSTTLAAFNLVGPITFSDPNACGLLPGSASIALEGVMSHIGGPFVEFGIGTFVPGEFDFDGLASDASTKTISGTIVIDSGPCANQSGPLTLVRQ